MGKQQLLQFLDAYSHLYKRLCPLVSLSVHPSVCPLVRRFNRQTRRHRSTQGVERRALSREKKSSLVFDQSPSMQTPTEACRELVGPSTRF